MLIVFKGHASLIMCDYNGKRIVLEKHKPKEVPKEVYDYILMSGTVDLKELVVVQPEVKQELETNDPPEVEIKKRGRPRK